MVADQFARFPNFDRLGPVSISGNELRAIVSWRHGNHHTATDGSKSERAHPRLAKAHPILCGHKLARHNREQFWRSKSQRMESTPPGGR
jgi:hypothetical protein